MLALAGTMMSRSPSGNVLLRGGDGVLGTHRLHRSGRCRAIGHDPRLGMTDATLRIERAGPVARIVLSRPERHNAQNPQMWRELMAAGAALAVDEEVRAVVVAGDGPARAPSVTRARVPASGSRPRPRGATTRRSACTPPMSWPRPSRRSSLACRAPRHAGWTSHFCWLPTAHRRGADPRPRDSDTSDLFCQAAAGAVEGCAVLVLSAR